MISKIVCSAHCFVFINGKRFGQASAVFWNSSTPSREIRGIDCIDAIELVTTTSSAGGSIAMYKVRADGGIQGVGMTQRSKYMPQGKYFTVAVIDRLSDTTIFRADRCRVESEEWGAPSKGFVSGNVHFKAIEQSNEIGS